MDCDSPRNAPSRHHHSLGDVLRQHPAAQDLRASAFRGAVEQAGKHWKCPEEKHV